MGGLPPMHCMQVSSDLRWPLHQMNCTSGIEFGVCFGVRLCLEEFSRPQSDCGTTEPLIAVRFVLYGAAAQRQVSNVLSEVGQSGHCKSSHSVRPHTPHQDMRAYNLLNGA